MSWAPPPKIRPVPTLDSTLYKAKDYGSWNGLPIIAIGPKGGKIVGYDSKGKPLYTTSPKAAKLAAQKKAAATKTNLKTSMGEWLVQTLGIPCKIMGPATESGLVRVSHASAAMLAEHFGVKGVFTGSDFINFKFTDLQAHMGKAFAPPKEGVVGFQASIAAGEDIDAEMPDLAQLKQIPAGEWAGSHSNKLYVDPKGRKWVFKSENPTIARAEEAASRIGRLILGKAIPPAKYVEVDGTKGVLIGEVPGKPLNASSHSSPPQPLLQKHFDEVLAHQVVDWLTSQHDGHAGNYLSDGKKLYGIDKGQAWKFFGKDSLTDFYKPNNSAQIFIPFWKALKSGAITGDPVAAVAKAVDAAEKITPEQYKAIVMPYAQEYGSFTGKDPNAWADKLTKRLTTLRADWEAFLSQQLGKPVTLPKETADNFETMPEVEAKGAKPKVTIKAPDAPKAIPEGAKQPIVEAAVPGWPVKKGNVTVHHPGEPPMPGVKYPKGYPGPGFKAQVDYKGETFTIEFEAGGKKGVMVTVFWPDGSSGTFDSPNKAGDAVYLHSKGLDINMTATEKKAKGISYPLKTLLKLKDFQKELEQGAMAPPAAPVESFPESVKEVPASQQVKLPDGIITDMSLLSAKVQHAVSVQSEKQVGVSYGKNPPPGTVFAVGGSVYVTAVKPNGTATYVEISDDTIEMHAPNELKITLPPDVLATIAIATDVGPQANVTPQMDVGTPPPVELPKAKTKTPPGPQTKDGFTPGTMVTAMKKDAVAGEKVECVLALNASGDVWSASFIDTEGNLQTKDGKSISEVTKWLWVQLKGYASVKDYEAATKKKAPGVSWGFWNIKTKKVSEENFETMPPQDAPGVGTAAPKSDKQAAAEAALKNVYAGTSIKYVPFSGDAITITQDDKGDWSVTAGASDLLGTKVTQTILDDLANGEFDVMDVTLPDFLSWIGAPPESSPEPIPFVPNKLADALGELGILDLKFDKGATVKAPTVEELNAMPKGTKIIRKSEHKEGERWDFYVKKDGHFWDHVGHNKTKLSDSWFTNYADELAVDETSALGFQTWLPSGWVNVIPPTEGDEAPVLPPNPFGVKTLPTEKVTDATFASTGNIKALPTGSVVTVVWPEDGMTDLYQKTDTGIWKYTNYNPKKKEWSGIGALFTGTFVADLAEHIVDPKTVVSFSQPMLDEEPPKPKPATAAAPTVQYLAGLSVGTEIVVAEPTGTLEFTYEKKDNGEWLMTSINNKKAQTIIPGPHGSAGNAKVLEQLIDSDGDYSIAEPKDLLPDGTVIPNWESMPPTIPNGAKIGSKYTEYGGTHATVFTKVPDGWEMESFVDGKSTGEPVVTSEDMLESMIEDEGAQAQYYQSGISTQGVLNDLPNPQDAGKVDVEGNVQALIQKHPLLAKYGSKLKVKPAKKKNHYNVVISGSGDIGVTDLQAVMDELGIEAAFPSHPKMSYGGAWATFSSAVLGQTKTVKWEADAAAAFEGQPAPKPKKPKDQKLKAIEDAEFQKQLAEAKKIAEWTKDHPLPSGLASKALAQWQTTLPEGLEGQVYAVQSGTDKLWLGAPENPEALAKALSAFQTKTVDTPLGSFLEIDAASFNTKFGKADITGPDGKTYPAGTKFKEKVTTKTVKEWMTPEVAKWKPHKSKPDWEVFKITGANDQQVLKAQTLLDQYFPLPLQKEAGVGTPIKGGSYTIAEVPKSLLSKEWSETSVEAKLPKAPPSFKWRPMPGLIGANQKPGTLAMPNRAELSAIKSLPIKTQMGHTIRMGSALKDMQVRVRKVVDPDGKRFYEVVGKLAKAPTNPQMLDGRHYQKSAFVKGGEPGTPPGFKLPEFDSEGFMKEVDGFGGWDWPAKRHTFSNGTDLSLFEKGTHNHDVGNKVGGLGKRFVARIPADLDVEDELANCFAQMGVDVDKAMTPKTNDQRLFIKREVVRHLHGLKGVEMALPATEGGLDKLIAKFPNGQELVDQAEVRVGLFGRHHVVFPKVEVPKHVAFVGATVNWQAALVNMIEHHRGMTSGYAAQVDRWLMGKHLGNLTSADEDEERGGSSAAFTTVHANDVSMKKGKNIAGWAGDGVQWVIHPKVLKRADWYSHHGDGFGNVLTMGYQNSTDKSNVDIHKQGDMQETLFQNGLAFEDFAGFNVKSAAVRQEMLSLLKEAGVTELNGKPIEAFIQVHSPETKPAVLAQAFNVEKE